MKHARCITLLVVCHTAGFAQRVERVDLSPLWPAEDASTGEIRQAIESGQISRATGILSTLDAPARNLWQGILFITQNDARS